PTDNPEAYDAYLRGLAYSLKTANTPANAIGAQKYLREAVRLDRKFALSWALLSYVGAINYSTQNFPTVALREEARQAGDTALSYVDLRRFPEALRKLDQVLDITPDDVDTLAIKAAIAQAEGDLPRAAGAPRSAPPGRRRHLCLGNTSLPSDPGASPCTSHSS